MLGKHVKHFDVAKSFDDSQSVWCSVITPEVTLIDKAKHLVSSDDDVMGESLHHILFILGTLLIRFNT